jgi:hypothetical protein
MANTNSLKTNPPQNRLRTPLPEDRHSSHH